MSVRDMSKGSAHSASEIKSSQRNAKKEISKNLNEATTSSPDPPKKTERKLKTTIGDRKGLRALREWTETLLGSDSDQDSSSRRKLFDALRMDRACSSAMGEGPER